MKVRIIKDFNISDTKVFGPGMEIEVTNDKAKQMITEGFAEEIIEGAKVVKVVTPEPEVKEEKEKKGKRTWQH